LPGVCGCARAPARIGVADVKLLLDENLSPRLLTRIRRFYPGSRHVEQVGLKGKSDWAIWQYPRQNDFIMGILGAENAAHGRSRCQGLTVIIFPGMYGILPIGAIIETFFKIWPGPTRKTERERKEG